MANFCAAKLINYNFCVHGVNYSRPSRGTLLSPVSITDSHRFHLAVSIILA